MNSFNLTEIAIMLLAAVTMLVGLGFVVQSLSFGYCVEAGMQWIDGDCVK